MKKLLKYLGILLSVTLMAACATKEDTDTTDIGLAIKVIFPTKVVTGTQMTISGQGFTDATEVVFPNDVSVTNFKIAGDGMIRVTVPAGVVAEGGPISVRTADETAQSHQKITMGQPAITGYSKQPGEKVSGGELLSIFGTDLEFVSSVELKDADGNPDVIPDTRFYRKGTNLVIIKVPNDVFDGDFKGKVNTLNGKTFEMPEMTYGPFTGGGHMEHQEIVVSEEETVFDAWSATLVVPAAKFVDAVEGGIVRVFFKDKTDDYLPIYKHVGDWSDWAEFQDGITHQAEYFEAAIKAEALDELKSEGLRFQGLGFTITSVVLIQDVWVEEEAAPTEETLWEEETPFDGWSATIVIGPEMFAKVKDGYTVRVFVKDKTDDFNPIFKHVGDWSDWTEFQDIIVTTDEYFESTVTEAVIGELQSDGLRFQGIGFTLVKVMLLPS